MNFASPTRTSSTKWNLAFQYAYAILAFISGFVLIPLYLKNIPIGLYGTWLATGNFLMWLTLIDPGLSTILQQRIALTYGQKDFDSAVSLITSGLLLTIVVSLLITIAGYFASNYLHYLFGGATVPDQQLLRKAFIIAAIGTSLSVFSYSVAAINLGLLGSLGVGTVQITITSLSIVMTIYFLMHGHGLMSIAYGGLIRGLGYTVGNSAYLLWRTSKERIHIYFSLKGLRILMKLISYTFFSRTVSVIAANLDSMMVVRVLGAEIAPILELTRKVPETSRMITERPAIAMIPGLAHVMGAGENKKAGLLLLRFFNSMVWLLFFIIGGLIAFNHSFVQLWVGEKFFAGNNISVILCLVLLVTVISNSLGNICFSLGEIKGTSRASIVQSIINIVCAYLGIKLFGLIGLVIAPLIGVLSVSGWYYPRILSRMAEIAQADVNKLLMEVAKSSAIIGGLILIFSGKEPNNWISFGVFVLTYAGLYISLLLLFSTTARNECLCLLRRSPLRVLK